MPSGSVSLNLKFLSFMLVTYTRLNVRNAHMGSVHLISLTQIVNISILSNGIKNVS